VRVRILGEDLVASRETSGQVGLLQANCPHRGASLFFKELGSNESLQRHDLMRYGGFGKVQRSRCPGEAAFTCDSHQDVELVERRLLPSNGHRTPLLPCASP